MSFIIRGGYFVSLKKVLNISLKSTDKWSQGLISVKASNYSILPHSENKIEIVKYNDNHALLLNNAIVYEDKKLFDYHIELEGFRALVLNDPNLYNFPECDFLECHYAECYALKHISTWRELN